MTGTGMLLEQLHFVKGQDPVADAYNTDPASDYVNLGLFDRCVFLVHEGIGTTGTATMTVTAASAAAGTGAEAIPFNYRVSTATDVFGDITAATAAGFATTAGSSHMYAIEALAQDTPAGKPWVALQMTELVDAAVLASVLVILGAPRFGPREDKLTAVA